MSSGGPETMTASLSRQTSIEVERRLRGRRAGAGTPGSEVRALFRAAEARLALRLFGHGTPDEPVITPADLPDP
jgi:hypothetical protein